MSNKNSQWIKPSGLQGLKTFSNDSIEIVGFIKTTVTGNESSTKYVKVTVVEDRHRSIIGRDVFSKLGRSGNKSTQLVNVNQNQCPVKQQQALVFPTLISRISKSHKHTVNSIFQNTLLQIIRKADDYCLTFNP